MNAMKKFEKRFENEILELFILTKSCVIGASSYENMLTPSVDFVASVNAQTGAFSQEKGLLEWIIEDVPDREGWGYDFEQNQIYRVRVRKNLSAQNCYMLVEVLEEDISEPQLDTMKEQLAVPVEICDETMGTFVLDRTFSWFEGEIDWVENTCTVYLTTDEEDSDTANKSFSYLKKLYQNQENWDKKFRDFAAKQLTELANDWYQDEDDDYDDDDDDKIHITEEDFFNRIELSELSIEEDGSLTLYYDDDEMFYGHSIEITADIDGEIESANIVG